MLRERLESATRGIDLVREFVLSPAADPAGAVARRGCLLANSNAELATSTPEVAAEARRSYDAQRRARFVTRAPGSPASATT